MSRKSRVQQKNSKEKSLPSRLYRSEENRMIGGVAGGLGEYFDVDPLIFRIIFIAFTVFGGSGILLYLILWLIVPSRSRMNLDAKDAMRENVQEMKGRAKGFADDVRGMSNRRNSRGWLGFVIVIIGFVFLFDALGVVSVFAMRRLWPLLIILLGFVILFRDEKK